MLCFALMSAAQRGRVALAALPRRRFPTFILQLRAQALALKRVSGFLREQTFPHTAQIHTAHLAASMPPLRACHTALPYFVRLLWKGHHISFYV